MVTILTSEVVFMAAISDSTSELLEQLAHLSHCCYLSDLQYLKAPCPAMQDALHAISSDAYTPQCWQSAWRYLTGNSQAKYADNMDYRLRLLAYYGGESRKSPSSP